MQTILLATGETKALRPLTDFIPSPMLPILNRPVMSYQLELLARQGVDESLVSLYHLADQIETYFETGAFWKVNLKYLLQPEPLGTAGALKWAEHSLTETFLCLPADAIYEIKIAALIEAHKASGCAATVVVFRRATYGLKRYRVDYAGRITGLGTRQPVGAIWYDTGVYIFEPEVLDFIPKRKSFDIYSQLIPELLAAELPVGMFELEQRYGLLDSFQSYSGLQWEFLYDCYQNQKTEPLVAPDWKGSQIAHGIWAGRNHKIHPRARLIPPVVIGENTFIGSDVQLGPDAVIGSNVMIDEGATVSHSIILDQTYIGLLIKIENYLVNQNFVIDFHSETCLTVGDSIFLNDTMLKKIGQKGARLLDIFIAVLLIILLAPMELLIALWLSISGCPIFERTAYLSRQPSQQGYRSPYHYPTIRLLRFATSKPYTRWIERFELHRIPELWNVLKGELKLVGLSPLPAEGAYKFPELWWYLRQSHSPGFTGLWYVQDCESSDPDDRMVADAYYFATHTFWQDIAIFFRTPFAWWRKLLHKQQTMTTKREGSYAVRNSLTR